MRLSFITILCTHGEYAISQRTKEGEYLTYTNQRRNNNNTSREPGIDAVEHQDLHNRVCALEAGFVLMKIEREEASHNDIHAYINGQDDPDEPLVIKRQGWVKMRV